MLGGLSRTAGRTVLVVSLTTAVRDAAAFSRPVHALTPLATVSSCYAKSPFQRRFATGGSKTEKTSGSSSRFGAVAMLLGGFAAAEFWKPNRDIHCKQLSMSAGSGQVGISKAASHKVAHTDDRPACLPCESLH
eukprot:1956008-Rhodomonas_salina.2